MANPEKWRGYAPLPEDIHRKIEALPSLLREHGVTLAYLFGSLASGGDGNDVDLALLRAEGPVFELRDALERRLDTQRLDLVDLERASPVWAFEIVSQGQCIFAADEDDRLDFELSVVRRYHDTAHLRRQQERLLRERLAS